LVKHNNSHAAVRNLMVSTIVLLIIHSVLRSLSIEASFHTQ
jgi:hypothetical protein